MVREMVLSSFMYATACLHIIWRPSSPGATTTGHQQLEAVRKAASESCCTESMALDLSIMHEIAYHCYPSLL